MQAVNTLNYDNKISRFQRVYSPALNTKERSKEMYFLAYGGGILILLGMITFIGTFVYDTNSDWGVDWFNTAISAAIVAVVAGLVCFIIGITMISKHDETVTNPAWAKATCAKSGGIRSYAQSPIDTIRAQVVCADGELHIKTD